MTAIFHLLFGWFGIATFIGIAAVAVAIFSVRITSVTPLPLQFLVTNLRHYAIATAIIAFSFTTIAGKYYNDGLKFKQAQWDAAVQAAVSQGEKARSDAERNITDNPDGVRDPDNRDR